MVCGERDSTRLCKTYRVQNTMSEVVVRSIWGQRDLWRVQGEIEFNILRRLVANSATSSLMGRSLTPDFK